jgi:hypothetical protein
MADSFLFAKTFRTVVRPTQRCTQCFPGTKSPDHLTHRVAQLFLPSVQGCFFRELKGQETPLGTVLFVTNSQFSTSLTIFIHKLQITTIYAQILILLKYTQITVVT